MDDSIELQPGGSDATDISSEKSLETISDPISTDPTDQQKNSYDRVFDISEDNIAEVKEDGANSMQVFPIKKVLPKTSPAKPPQPKITSSSGWTVNTNTEIPKPENITPSNSIVAPTVTTPQINSNLPPINPSPISSIQPSVNLAPEPPSKNIFDPSYSKIPNQTPVTEASKSQIIDEKTQPSISKFAAEKLPEIPAFKGTFDQKPPSFEPKSFIQDRPKNITPTDDKVVQPTQTTPNISEKPLEKEKIETKTELPNTPTQTIPIATIPEVVTEENLKNTPSKNILDSSFTDPGETKKEKSIGSIPLKDITPQNSPLRNTPSNPPAKVLGTIPATNTENKFDVPENPNLKRIRTYESDIADVMSQKNISTASMVIAENKRTQINTQIIQPQEQENNQNPKEIKPNGNKNISKFILMIISITFIAIGIGGAYYLYSNSIFGLKTSILGINPTQNSSNIISTDSKVTLDISSMDPNTIVAAIKNEWEKPQNPDTIQEIIITDGQIRVTGPRMVEFMDIDAPDILKRSLTNNWMLGISADASGNKDIFVIATTNFFQNAFAGMFQWESVMADDLKLFLSSGRYQGIVNAPIGTSTITIDGPSLSVTATDNTPNDESPESPFTIRGQFEDRTIMNKDVRVFRTTQGKILFFYSFVDNATIVIASKEQTLIKILDSLEKKAFIR